MNEPIEDQRRDVGLPPLQGAHQEHYYDKEAEHYDEVRFMGAGGKLSAALDDALVIALLEPAKNEIFLDIPAGTARSSLAIAKRGAAVCGVDLSIEMLQRGLRKIGREVNVQITLVQADAQCLPFPSQSIDGVCCLRLFHLLPPEERHAFVAEFHRVLRPNGLLLVEFPRRLHAAGLVWLADLIRGTRKWYYLGLGEHRSLFQGFSLVRVVGGYLPLMRILAKYDPDTALKVSIFLARTPLRVFSRQAFVLLRKSK